MTWLRPDAAAVHVGIHRSTLQEWLNNGLTSYKDAGSVLIDQVELDDFVRGHRRRTAIRRHCGNNPNLASLMRRLK